MLSLLCVWSYGHTVVIIWPLLEESVDWNFNSDRTLEYKCYLGAGGHLLFLSPPPFVLKDQCLSVTQKGVSALVVLCTSLHPVTKSLLAPSGISSVHRHECHLDVGKMLLAIQIS